MTNTIQPMFKQQNYQGYLITTFAVFMEDPDMGHHFEVTQIVCDASDHSVVRHWDRSGFIPQQERDLKPLGLLAYITSPDNLDKLLKGGNETVQENIVYNDEDTVVKLQ